MSHTAVLRLVDDGQETRVVVDSADDEIWISQDLMAKVRKGPRVPGQLERDGDLLRFGIAGEGMGRLTYRVTGQLLDQFKQRWTVAERVRDGE